MNYFELFEIPVSLQVDPALLSKQYVALQKKYHPDFFTQSGEDEQAEALHFSSELNKGLKILRNPDETIKYVLQLKGILTDDEKYQLPPDFLMEMMELNESLEEGSAAGIEAIQNELYEAVAPIITGFDNTKTTETELLQLKEYYFKKKYLQRILERLDD